LSVAHQFVLYATTFVAGLLNATVGGGGLLQVPVLMLLLPGESLATLLGTAKLAGLPGLAGACATFARRLEPIWPLILRAGIAEIPFSILGARIATRLDAAVARPVLILMLAAMSAHVLLRPRFGQAVAGRAPTFRGPLPWVIGAGVGLYEGFLGSGSGSILIVLFVVMNGLDLVDASVASAMVTLAGVVAALATFLADGAVLPGLAVKMAAFNLIGSLIGARLVMLRENRLLKRMLGAMLIALLARLAWDIYAETT
jgi:uncharacterized membrane protein YfcA